MFECLKKIVELKRNLSRYRLKKQFRKPFRIIGITLILVIVASLVYSPIANYYSGLANNKVYGKIKVDWYKDLNPEHLKSAKKNGIKPFKTNKGFIDEVKALVEDGKLVRIKNSWNYQVEKLTYSHPYLTPDANKFLDDLGKRFQKKLKENGMGTFAYQISSLLRTEESQRALSKSNRNASPNSSHLYGTTFDIAYDSVIKKPLPWMKVQMADPKAIKLLSEAIGELRNEKRCLVVTEKLEKCFHITILK